MNKVVSVVDYGMGNLFSVREAVESFGYQVQLVSSAEELKNAQKIILPGVGAFRDGMQKLNESGFSSALQEAFTEGKSMLGICLGMQLLLNSSEEFGFTKGLGLVPGKVLEIPRKKKDGSVRKVPHIGWAQIKSKTPFFEENDYFYFVHSFYADLEEKELSIATCEYEGFEFCVALKYKNLMGVQFHPERSAQSGLNFLAKFLELR